MDNIISYVEKEFRGFDERPFNEVDSLVLSWLSYIRWPIACHNKENDKHYSFYEMFQAEHFSEMFGNIKDKDLTRQLLTAVVASPRYRCMRMSDYRSHTDLRQEIQFAAVTFHITDDLLYVAYRGTDSTFVGWKEDLNMAFQYPIPAQVFAAEYLNSILQKSVGKVFVGGHSKGGNLAVFAAAQNTQYLDRVEKIYSHDGPGFLKEVLDSDAFQLIQSKVEKTVPQSSIIGMLLEQHGDYQIIESSEKGFWQHNPFTWRVEDGSLCHLSELTKDAEIVDHAVNAWLGTISKEERERFVDAIYSLSNNIEADNFLDFGQSWQSYVPQIMGTVKDMDSETKTFVFQIIKSLITYSVKTIPDGVKEGIFVKRNDNLR